MTKSSHPFRVVQCCFCGGRSTISGRRDGPLVCHACGAPLSKLEPLQPDMERRKRKRHKDAPKRAIPHAAERPGQHLDKDRPAKRKKGKRRKRSLWYHIGEALDDWDDVFDLFD